MLPRGERIGLMILLFLSGAAGLIYQVLWMRQLGLLFGSTSHAASATLSAFFGGLAAGSWFWGKRSGHSKNPLRLYAWLEAGIALTALLYFVILHIFYGIYPVLYRSVTSTELKLLVKFALAILLVFPASFCMGGTLPAIVQHRVRSRSLFGKASARLYGINTLGAASGVVVAIFLLIPGLGFRLTYTIAILTSAAVAITAGWLARGRTQSIRDTTEEQAGAPERRAATAAGDHEKVASSGYTRWVIGCLSFLSGFAMLALEVLWTRMFAQIHENSVYSFAVILTVVLTCLAAGAWISARLARFQIRPLLMLGILTTLGGAALTLGPTLFMTVTNNITSLSSLELWWHYVLRIFGLGFGGIGIIVIILGTIFPFLMKANEHALKEPGQALGRLLALNTLGAIAGSLLCGFLLLPTLGAWRSMQLITAGYLFVGLLLPFAWSGAGIACRSVAILALWLLFGALDPSQLRVYGSNTGTEGEEVLKKWEDPDSTVTVVKTRSENLAIRINSGYILGSTVPTALMEQVYQTRIPLYAFPETRSIFYLGLGTGITAGAALNSQFDAVEEIVACELSPAVMDAARHYIPRVYTGGIFSDPRAKVRAEDGRHYLQVSDKRFDMINADLFLPYRRGAGSLYSLDHYRAAAKRLNPGGVFVQWVPLFQITGQEFGIIVRTMLEAFGQVTLWRNNFTPGHEQVALVGHTSADPITPTPAVTQEEMLTALRRLKWQKIEPEMAVPHPSTILFYYCGNVTKARDMFNKFPINTDDKPLVEYLTPRLFRDVAEKERIIWYVGPRIADTIEQIQSYCPPLTDPMLKDFERPRRKLVLAGNAFHRSLVDKKTQKKNSSLRHWQTFEQNWRAAAQRTNEGSVE